MQVDPVRCPESIGNAGLRQRVCELGSRRTSSPSPCLAGVPRGCDDAGVTLQPGHSRSRLLNPRVGRLLAGNTAISCATFCCGLAILWALVDGGGVDKYLATAVSFLVATTLHYVACRVWLYPDADRGIAAGYLFFFVNAGVGLLITMALFAAFADLLRINYLVARVLASVAAGLAIFLLNAVFNFAAVCRCFRECAEARIPPVRLFPNNR